MKLTYDKETDTLLVVFTNKAIDETEEIRPGVLADLDENGALVSLEILNASSKVDDFERTPCQAFAGGIGSGMTRSL
jgi:uncharacterized protein YuzE